MGLGLLARIMGSTLACPEWTPATVTHPALAGSALPDGGLGRRAENMVITECGN